MGAKKDDGEIDKAFQTKEVPYEFQNSRISELEHEELHADLVRTTKAGGETGAAAKAVAKVLHDHFVKEEEFALPPIGLLAALTRGKVDEQMRGVLVMTDRLKAELPDMLREHEAVVAALTKLTAAAKKENCRNTRALRKS